MAVMASYDENTSLNKELLKDSLNKIDGINPQPSFNATSFPASCGLSLLFSGKFSCSFLPTHVTVPTSVIVNSYPSTFTFRKGSQ